MNIKQIKSIVRLRVQQGYTHVSIKTNYSKNDIRLNLSDIKFCNGAIYCEDETFGTAYYIAEDYILSLFFTKQ